MNPYELLLERIALALEKSVSESAQMSERSTAVLMEQLTMATQHIKVLNAHIAACPTCRKTAPDFPDDEGERRH